MGLVNPIDILTCEIRIGAPDPASPIKIQNPILLTEVKEITITESYKDLIGSAKVSFPKGSVYQSVIIDNVTLDGIDATSVFVNRMEDGVLIEKRTTQVPVSEVAFIVGQRISIKLGYNGNIKSMFEGYIKGVSSDDDVILECENLAYKLKQKQAPKITTPKKTYINDLCGEKYGLLKGTNFELHKSTKEWNIQIGEVRITDNFTVADILESWSKMGLYCYLKYESDDYSQMPKIAIGRPYSSKKSEMFSDGSEVQVTVISDRPEVYNIQKQKNRNSAKYYIDFLYNVAENRLTTTKVDPKFLAVKAQGLGSDEKFFSVTVRRNPDYDPTDKNSKEFQTVNATQISKKRHKVTGNKTASGAETKTKVDMDSYTVVPYHSTKKNITSDALVEEAINYFKNYNLNGVKGSLLLFGDFGIRTGVQVEIDDPRNSSKNGVYLVEKVTTTFGVNGYFQDIEIPYKIQSVETYGKN